MATFRIVTTIAAPIEVCFDLSRDIDFHTRSLAGTGERAVAGRTSGLIELGESVTWEAKHLGVHQRLTSEVTAFDRPTYFRDVMTRGAFESFAHDHHFEAHGDETAMIDDIVFRSPLGPLGWLVDRLFMTRYLRRLIEGRCQAIKREAERTAEASVFVKWPASTGVNWLIPWRPIVGATPEDGASRQLYCELGRRHILYGIKVRPVGHRQDCDDVLFELLDGSGRFAVVHLTYAQHPESDPRWPRSDIYADWSTFERDRMRPDAEEWADITRSL